MNIKIFCARTQGLIEQRSLSALLEQIPASQRGKAERYKSDLSAYNYVVGRLLLKRGLEDFNLSTDFKKICIKENGKPSLPNIHFSISHSGHHVCCAISKDGELGLDIEQIKPIPFDDFSYMFSAKEWNSIKTANHPLQTFYWFWTRKESIIKANGLSLGEMHKIDLDVTCNYFVSHGMDWHLKEVDFGEGLIGTICAENEIKTLSLKQLNLKV